MSSTDQNQDPSTKSETTPPSPADGKGRRKSKKRRPDLDTVYTINTDGSRNFMHPADVTGPRRPAPAGRHRPGFVARPAEALHQAGHLVLHAAGRRQVVGADDGDLHDGSPS